MRRAGPRVRRALRLCHHEKRISRRCRPLLRGPCERHLRLAVLLFEDDASERLIDPVGPLVEAFMHLFAVIVHLVSVEGHDGLRAGMAKYKGKHSHLEEFKLGLLALGRSSTLARRAARVH